ncbi:hypothetical protein [Vibrio neptunius]|uniref:hypothetical protein n=1 Tax=Vibrio neptunius TaxID=170651 RepID=UPI003CE4EF9E
MFSWLKETSTLKSLALLGGVAAAATGHGDLFSVEVSEAGVQYGGAAGAVIVAGVGLWEALPDSWKP